MNKTVYTDDYYYYTLKDNFSTKQTEDFIQNKKKIQWFLFFKTPIIIALKVLMVSVLIFAGLNFYSKDLEFGKIIEITLQAEIIFLLLPLIRFIWFNINQDSSFEQIINFPTFSLFDFFSQNDFQSSLKYVLKTVNLFEAVYILLITHLLSKEIQVRFNQSFGIVLSSYGLGLVLWVVIVSFMKVSVGV